MNSWSWPPADEKRVASAHKVKVLSSDLSAENPSIQCEGSGGNVYFVTLDGCTCPDFSINLAKGSSMACKHMIRLGMLLKILDKEGRTDREQFLDDFQRLEDQLSRCAWLYYVRDEPIVSDKEYDEMKAAYLAMLDKHREIMKERTVRLL